MKLTLKELSEKIEKENELFNSFSPEMKRIQIAKDVLIRIEIGNILPKNVHFIEDKYQLKRAGHDLKTVINSIPNCSCCAKGALFLSQIGRTNSFDTCDFSLTGYGMNSSKGNEHKKLLELFSLEQLDMIETAFEGKSYLLEISKELKETVIAWRKKQKVNKTKLLQRISRNLIRNQGTFVV